MKDTSLYSTLEDGTIARNPMIVSPNPHPNGDKARDGEESFFSVPGDDKKESRRKGSEASKKFRTRIPTPSVKVSDDKVSELEYENKLLKLKMEKMEAELKIKELEGRLGQV